MIDGMVMESVPAPLTTALARLESRWGSAAVRLGSSNMSGQYPGCPVAPGPRGSAAPECPGSPTVDGALALAASPQPAPELGPSLPDDIVPTGFARLDALLGTGGLPRGVSASFRGARSSGKTALALHCLAQAQARGGIVAFLDLCRIFDPLEAVGTRRGPALAARAAARGRGRGLGAGRGPRHRVAR